MQLKAINFPELTFKMNPIKVQEQVKFEIKPRFEREVKVSNENPNIYVVNLICKIISTDNEPKPFNLIVNVAGIFEIDTRLGFNQKEFEINSTKLLFPYLRSAIANMTSTANISPLHLPILPDGILFPEDRVQTVND